MTVSINPVSSITDRASHDEIVLAWHDVTCPRGVGCWDRELHAMSDLLAGSGVVERFLCRLEAVLDNPGRQPRSQYPPEYYLG